MDLQNTIGNEEWMKENENAIKEMLPDTWTHISNFNGLHLGYNLKLLGVDWQSEKEFSLIMTYLEKIGMMLREGVTVRRSQRSIFKQ
jgi:hypothetical protein